MQLKVGVEVGFAHDVGGLALPERALNYPRICLGSALHDLRRPPVLRRPRRKAWIVTVYQTRAGSATLVSMMTR